MLINVYAGRDVWLQLSYDEDLLAKRVQCSPKPFWKIYGTTTRTSEEDESNIEDAADDLEVEI